MTLEDTITIARSHAQGGPPLDVPVPRRLGSVKLLKEIGRGGTGVVYSGRDEVLHRTVAVKFLSGAVPSPTDPGFAEFLEGARAAAAVHRSGLTTIYSAGVVEGLPYVIMQFIDGPTVAQLLRHEPFTLADAMNLLVQAVELTAELHEHGIVHRDIKPSNLLVDLDGHLYLADFGLAHHRRSIDDVRPISWAGTPAYMAPEMFEGQVSPRTDVYALGIMAFELVTGHLSFSGTLEEVRQQHVSKDLPLEELKKHGVKRELLDVLERAAHKKTMFRYKSASQFARALRGAYADLGTPMQAEMGLMQRVNRWRSAAGAGSGVTASTSRPAGSDTPPSHVSLHDHMAELISMRKSIRDAAGGGGLGSKSYEVPQAPAAPPPFADAGASSSGDAAPGASEEAAQKEGGGWWARIFRRGRRK
jgi:serine/threonine-protein kinase